jgi:hypothetical protein
MLSFSQCRPEDNSSASFFDSARSLMRSESSLCVILCGSAKVTFRKNSRSLEVDGCGLSSGVFSSSSSQSSEKLSGGSQIGTPSQWGTGIIADDIFGHSTVHFFFLAIPFWIWGTVQK